MDQRTKQLPADERRAHTVATVLALAAERDPIEITTAAIAERMQVTQGALFRHFPSKEDIWRAVLQWVGGELLARTEAAAAAARSALDSLEAMFMAHIALVAEHPGLPRLLFGELQRAQDTAAKRVARSIVKRYRDRLLVLLAHGKSNGEIPEAIDDDAAATMYIGMVQGLIVQSLLSGNVKQLRSAAPGAFHLYRRAISSATGRRA